MDPKKLKPGTYRLKTRVDNPDADRRRLNDWQSVAQWEAGTEFIVLEEVFHGIGERITEKIVYIVSDSGAARVQRGMIANHRRAVRALVDAFEPAPESVLGMMLRINCNIQPSYFVLWLLENKHISRRRFEKLWRTYAESD